MGLAANTLTLELQTGGVVNGKGHIVFVKDIMSNVAVVCLEVRAALFSTFSSFRKVNGHSPQLFRILL